MIRPDKHEEVQKPCIQSEEMPALGQLAEAFAHKIRNHLQIVLAGVGYLSNTLPQEERSIISIDKVKRAVHRADKIISDFLRFFAMSEFAFESVDLCNLLDESVSALKNRPNFNQIKIDNHCPEKPITVRADRNMLQQVFINLFANALDAMPNRGELKIRAFSEIGSSAGHITGNDLKVGDKMAVVEIEDTGKGIPKDVLPKIFEPFFTINKLSNGTGLGLSMVNLIVDRHQGSIDVESEINKGTRFIIKLPQSRIPEKNIHMTDRK
jgi:signal transduction histidine kinase